MFKLLSEQEIEKLIRQAVLKLTPDDIINAMRSGKDVFDLLFYNHFHKWISNPATAWIIKLGFRKYWHLVEKYLANVKNLYDLLWTNPSLRPLLRRRDVIEWLNKQAEKSYYKLYKWVWG